VSLIGKFARNIHLVSLPVERSQILDQILLFLGGEIQRNHCIVEVRILDATFIVEIDHFFKRNEPPVIAYTARFGDLTQRWGLEGAIWSSSPVILYRPTFTFWSASFVPLSSRCLDCDTIFSSRVRKF